jgi:hypothetical protein
MKRELVDGGSAYGLVSIVTEPSARLCFVLGVASVIDGPWLACRWQVAVGWAHPAAAPLSALLRIGGKRKPRSTEANGASRTGNFGEGAGALFPVHLRKTTTRAGLGSGGSQQLGQLGDVGDAPGLVMSQQHGQWRISANIPVDCICRSLTT